MWKGQPKHRIGAGRSGTRGPSTLNYPPVTRRIRLFSAFALATGVLAVLPGAALALNPVVANCNATLGRLTHHYTIAQLQTAYNSIPAANREYSTCGQVIENQLQAQLKGIHIKPSGSGGGSNSTVPIVIGVVIVLILGGGGVLALRSRRSG